MQPAVLEPAPAETSTIGKSVLILGGGLAGLATAQALAPQGYRVTILEARNRLGGRAGSFTDATTGQLIDACQHVNMGCCTSFAQFCTAVGITQYLQPQPVLTFMTPDRRTSTVRADNWPAPWHLARSLASAHYLSVAEKLRITWGLACLQRTSAAIDPPFLPWLQAHGQTPRTIDRFWGLVLTSALNEATERVGLRYARKVFLDAFLGDRKGFEVQIPTVPLGQLYGTELQDWLRRHGVRVELNTGIKRLAIDGDGVTGAIARDGSEWIADAYVSALPFDRLLAVLPPETIDAHPAFSHLRNLETSPITSVHLWYRCPITPLPHAVLVDCVGQWVFNRGAVAPDEHYAQVVVSAARQFRGLGHDEVQRRIVAEMARLFPAATAENVVRARVVTEQAATFSAVPGVDRWRPSQESPIGNLFLAGDWTATGWPATMEGAVRSGYMAASRLATLRGSVVSS